MTTHLAWSLVKAALTIAAVVILLGQCRRPRGWPGRLIIRLMNQQHAGLIRWGLEFATVEPRFAILDVGCGGGKTIQQLAALASAGRVDGIDYSAASVTEARQVNAAGIAAGRVAIQEASVSRLPFPDNSFDLVTAVETHYYWPEPVNDLREIVRVLKPRGRVLLIAEAYKGKGIGGLMAIPMKLLRARYLTVGEHRDWLAAAGLTDIAIHENTGRGWICCVGQKAAQTAKTAGV